MTSVGIGEGHVPPAPFTVWPADVATLSIDVGGTGLKASVLDAKGTMLHDRVKVPTPYPCPPDVFVPALRSLTADLPDHDRVSVGFPGLVRRQRVLVVPSLSRKEYGGEPYEPSVQAWTGYPIGSALEEAFGKPVRVLNDADMQGCAAVSGHGLEFVMTLGTGCGTAIFLDGLLMPHLELSHLPFVKEGTFDIVLGEANRQAVGSKKWTTYVLAAIDAYREALHWDRMYLGGGNTEHLKQEPPPDVSIVPNTAGILGGVRAWDLPEAP